MSIENAGPGDLREVADQEGLFDFPISVPKGNHQVSPAELEVLRDRAAAGGNASAERRSQEPNDPRGVYADADSSPARVEETAPYLRNSEADTGIDKAHEAQADKIKAARLEEAKARRAVEDAVHNKAQAEFGPKPGVDFAHNETFAERNLREAAERGAAARAAETERIAANDRFRANMIETPAEAAELARRLREAQQSIDEADQSAAS